MQQSNTQATAIHLRILDSSSLRQTNNKQSNTKLQGPPPVVKEMNERVGECEPLALSTPRATVQKIIGEMLLAIGFQPVSRASLTDMHYVRYYVLRRSTILDICLNE